MGKLAEMLETFRNDDHWNTPEPGGGHRFDKELERIEGMIKAYAEKLGLSADEVAEIMEEKRTYSWPNYYQPYSFPQPRQPKSCGRFRHLRCFP